MSVLIIGATEREKIAEIISEAKAHPILLETIRDLAFEPQGKPIFELKDRPADFNRKQNAYCIEFPGGFRACLAVEQQPAGFCTHLSISTQGRSTSGTMPAEAVVKTICEEFDVPYPGDEIWIEEYAPGEYCLNTVSVYEETKSGNG